MRGGCLPLILAAILLYVWLNYDGGSVGISPIGPGGLQSESFDPGNPRRPDPTTRERFIIQDEEAPQDSQGTAFLIDSDGVWLTAEHVTRYCDRLGLADGAFATEVGQVLESAESDAALIRDGLPGPEPFALSSRAPQVGDLAYHMGFPGGRPTIVASRFIGAASAQRGMAGNRFEPIYAWAEEARSPDVEGQLSGISGGPTFSADGAVIGINSAASPRRGRVLTTDPRAIQRLVTASGDVDERPRAIPFTSAADARARFDYYRRSGSIRQVYCDVN